MRDKRRLRQAGADEQPAVLLDRVRADLQRRGVARDLCDRMAVQLCERHGCRSLPTRQYEALIDGAVLASGVHCEVEGDSADSGDRVREIERMMQAFAGELAKLDETLEVLATYVRRMRTEQPEQPVAVRGDQTLH